MHLGPGNISIGETGVWSPAAGSSCRNVHGERRVSLWLSLTAGRLETSVWIPWACLFQGQMEYFAWKLPGESF